MCTIFQHSPDGPRLLEVVDKVLFFVNRYSVLQTKMIGHAYLPAGAGENLKTTMSRAWDIFPDSSRKNREDG